MLEMKLWTSLEIKYNNWRPVNVNISIQFVAIHTYVNTIYNTRINFQLHPCTSESRVINVKEREEAEYTLITSKQKQKR